MLTWWISEALPLPVTALLPLVLFPLLGIANVDLVAKSYSDPMIFLYLAGFIMALAIEKSRLHTRIALCILKLVGVNAQHIIAGFLISTAFISMWMSNTATALIMLPIALSLMDLLLKDHPEQPLPGKLRDEFSTAIMLSVAYASSIGGTATIIGTPTNLIFVSFMKEHYGITITFLEWLIIGIPYMLLMLFFTWFCLTKLFFKNIKGNIHGSHDVIRKELDSLGSMSRSEITIASIFAITVLLWIIRPFLIDLFPSLNLTDTTIAIIGATLTFLVPINWKNYETLLDWKLTQKLPWGVLLLFGGGLALAAALSQTGVLQAVGNAMGELHHLPIIVILLSITFVAILLTELMSNMALVAVFLPIVSSVVVAFGHPPAIAAIPTTLGASSGYMLPMSTPPNAIAYGTGYVKLRDMLRIGLALNLISCLIITLLAYTLITDAFRN